MNNSIIDLKKQIILKLLKNNLLGICFCYWRRLWTQSWNEIMQKIWQIVGYSRPWSWLSRTADINKIEKVRMDQRPRYFFSWIYFFRTIDYLFLLQKGGHKMLDFYYIQISCFSLLYMHVNFILWTKNNPSDEITALFTFNICFIKIYFWTPKCQGWNCRMLDRFSLLLF